MKYSSLLIFLLFPFLAVSQDWLDHATIKDAHASAVFIDVESGKKVLGHNENKLLNPASTIKLLTSLMILNEKGENYQYETKLLYAGKIEKDGTLEGNLIIRGSGDPSLGSARYGEKNSVEAFLEKCVASAKREGITCIEGDIVVDASAFGSDCVPHTWSYNDLGNYYAAGVWGVNVNENSYKLSFQRKGKKIAGTTIQPPIPQLFFTNELELGAPDSGDQAYVFCAPYQSHAYIRGSIPRGKGNFSIRGSMPNAPLFLGVSLQKTLEDNGIKSQRVHVEFDKQITGKSIFTHNGIPLKRIVKSAIQKSINLYCESFLKTLGSGDRADGIEFMEAELKKIGAIKTEADIQLADGSGLSQRNYISANTQAEFLRKTYKSNPSIKELLARNGYDGTLKNKFVSKSLNGKIYGKSGSMGNVRAYTGILKTNSGKELAFSIMVNNYTANYRDVDNHIQRLLEKAVGM